ncbi:hypothetical protein LguiB_010393 [Lonicera macranthoides]
MARRLNMALFMALMAIAAFQMQSSEAQTTHIVGGSLGWTVPPAGPIAYITWAATQNFTVGDVLVFNYPTNVHDVGEVTQSAFDGCNGTNPISLSTAGPTNITLSSAGTHHFICTVGTHCNLGQKLAINVSAAASTPPPAAAPTTPPPAPAPTTPPPAAAPTTPPPAAAPQPAAAPPPASTPTPVASPAPTPARAPVTHVVGGNQGWNILPGGAAAYRTWASSQTFAVGDILEFNFINGTHDVAELNRSAFDSCNTTTTLSNITISPARITLSTAGEHFFTCTFPRHCTLGQQLAINVTSTATSPPNSAAPTPSTTATPPPPSASSPDGVTAPPPPSGSSPAFAVAALPITFLSVALAFLY